MPLYSHLNLRIMTTAIGLLAFILLAPFPGISAAESSRPNIILVMPDDAGYGDYACLGSPIIRTPSVDAFKQESLLFTQFHVSPKCAPSRAALMGGRHAFKSGVTHTVFERERLSLETVTLADMLQSAGYTTGIFGKWHLGDEEAYRPENRGFDEVYIHGAGGIGQTYPGSCGDAPGNSNINPALWHNGKWEKTTGYCTDLFFAQAARWMDDQRQAKQPFFAYIAPNAPHSPYVLPKEYYQHYLDKPGVDATLAKFYGMLENIDTNFGALLVKLKDWGIEENTLVIYLGSDNGGTRGVRIFNAGMRDGKGSPYQGGTRVPCFFRWPASRIPAGTESAALTDHVDLFPTLAELTGAKLSPQTQRQIEGRSLAQLLKDPQAEWADRTLVHHFGNWAQGTAAEYKHIRSSIQNSRFSLVADTELYDIQADPGETTNVISEYPEVAAKLRAVYDQWWQDVQPFLVNENIVGPKTNPMKELYWKQFGGGPNASMLKRMDPTTAVRKSQEIAGKNMRSWVNR